MSTLLIRYRFRTLVSVLALLAVLAAWGRRVTYEQSLTSFFPSNDPDVLAYQRASSAFGNDNLVFIVYKDPKLLTPQGMDRVAELAKSLGGGRIDGVLDVQSLDSAPEFWAIDDRLLTLLKMPRLLRAGALKTVQGLLGSVDLSIGRAIRKAGPDELVALRQRIKTHPLLQGTLVSADGESTALVARLKGMAEHDPNATITGLRNTADQFAATHGLGRPALVGPPVLLADGFRSIEIDGDRLAVAGMALIGLVTLTATRSLWWTIVPLLAGWTTWLAAETLLSVLNLKLSLSGGPLVAQIIVLTMPAASHLAIHFRDELRREPDRQRAARLTLDAVSRPIVWCALTGAIGYGALLTSRVVPVFQFGAILAVCTLFSALVTLTLSPLAMRPPFRLELPVGPGSTSRLGGFLNRLTAWVVEHPALVVVGTALLVVPLSLGMVRLRYESNYINAFKPQTRVVQDYLTAESTLGGIGLVSIVAPLGSAVDGDAVRQLRELERAIGELRQGGHPAVTRTLSLGSVLDPEGRLSALPDDQADEAIRTKLDLIRASAQASLLRNFWNPEVDGGVARILIRISEQQEAPAKEETFRDALGLTRAVPRFGERAYLTGLSYLLTQTTRAVMRTSWTTFLISALGILAMLSLAFRGPKLALLALLPTLLAVAFVIGIMGWLGIPMDIATALVASVALGLSVDDTFHCLLEYRRHRQENVPFQTSLLASYAVTGPGVLLSSLAVALGFAVLWFSQFVPFSNFGAMVGIATLGSSLGNLILLPACLSLGERLRWRKVTAPSGSPRRELP